MQRISFELEFDASSLSAARAIAESKIASYLGVAEEDVPKMAEVEFKIKTNADGVDRTHAYVTIKRTISSL